MVASKCHTARARYGGHGTFKARLFVGQLGETLVERWLRSRGFIALRTCELPAGEVGGPAILTPDGSVLPVPDLLALRAGRARWLEVKQKAGATLHRVSGDWCTGISERELQAYSAVQSATRLPFWLAFLHVRGTAPLGLLGATLPKLRACVHHRAAGMVFWCVEDLRLLATQDEIEALPP